MCLAMCWVLGTPAESTDTALTLQPFPAYMEKGIQTRSHTTKYPVVHCGRPSMGGPEWD